VFLVDVEAMGITVAFAVVVLLLVVVWVEVEGFEEVVVVVFLVVVVLVVVDGTSCSGRIEDTPQNEAMSAVYGQGRLQHTPTLKLLLVQLSPILQ